MGLEQLCREISATAEARAAALIKEAQESADHALAQARADGQKAVVAAKEEGEAFGQAETVERTNAAKLEEQKALSEAREEAVRRGIETVWAHYRTQSRRPGYAKNLRRWAEMAVAELDTPSYVLRARAEDIKLLSESGFKVSKEPLECSGGVKAETAGGRISVDYTLESLFEARREQAYKEVHARLFSDESGMALEGRKTGARASGKAASKMARASLAPRSGSKAGRMKKSNAKPMGRTGTTSRSRPSARRGAKNKRGRR